MRKDSGYIAKEEDHTERVSDRVTEDIKIDEETEEEARHRVRWEQMKHWGGR